MQTEPSDANSIKEFQKLVHTFYIQNGRFNLPWRQAEPNGLFDPYKILVSEVMLQQTQVSRVIPKYHQFLSRFPTIKSLATTSLSDVLTEWSGLGYYRRAKFLHQSADIVMKQFDDVLPKNLLKLTSLPGIGKNTAAAILAYSYSQPVTFIETNIRTVFLHHFFSNDSLVPDSQILPLVEQALNKTNPREWYWALMDYGSFLKSTAANPNRRSKHYTRQSTFEGSNRQLRGKVLKLLTAGPQSGRQLQNEITDSRLKFVLSQLEQEGLITAQTNNTYTLGK